jgi:hypothetical protein
MKNQPEPGAIQELIDLVMYSGSPHEIKMCMLEALEASIEAAFAKGATQVKPVRLMTADDLVS